LIYSGNESNTFGTGFMSNRKYKQTIMNCEAVDDSICYLRIGGNFNNVTIIWVPAAAEERTSCLGLLLRYTESDISKNSGM
jgi:hypothetical protein